MNEDKAKKPKQGTQLYENLFVSGDTTATLKLLSEGITAILSNAKRLLEDVTLLVNNERYASAGFLLTTTDEELSKVYILLDTCRLDFSRHESVLRALCRAFYDHVAKHAYKVLMRFPNLYDMSHAKEVWDIEVTRWWPVSDPESGEPDMPHETYFTREMPLYVDFIEYDRRWFVPDHDTRKYIFEDHFSDEILGKTKEEIELLATNIDIGLFRSECLFILNEIFKKHYITEKTTNDEIDNLYVAVAHHIEDRQGISLEKFIKSALYRWPLYHFAATKL